MSPHLNVCMESGGRGGNLLNWENVLSINAETASSHLFSFGTHLYACFPPPRRRTVFPSFIASLKFFNYLICGISNHLASFIWAADQDIERYQPMSRKKTTVLVVYLFMEMRSSVKSAVTPFSGHMYHSLTQTGNKG